MNEYQNAGQEKCCDFVLLSDISLLALIHNMALSNGYCVSTVSQLAAWVTQVSHNAVTGNRSVPIPGLCLSSVTIVAASVILLLTPILSFISVHVWKVFTSRHANMGALLWRVGLRLARLQRIIAKSRKTRMSCVQSTLSNTNFSRNIHPSFKRLLTMNLWPLGALLLLRPMPIKLSLIILVYWMQHSCHEKYRASVVRLVRRLG